jgi:hypothetical protein
MQFDLGSRHGKIVAGTGEPGSRTHELHSPRAMCFLPDGSFLITDAENERIVRYSNGLPSIVASTSEQEGEGKGGAKKACGIAAQADGTVLLSDWEKNRLLRFSPDIWNGKFQMRLRASIPKLVETLDISSFQSALLRNLRLLCFDVDLAEELAKLRLVDKLIKMPNWTARQVLEALARHDSTAQYLTETFPELLQMLRNPDLCAHAVQCLSIYAPYQSFASSSTRKL